jgi:hypothetical protein
MSISRNCLGAWPKRSRRTQWRLRRLPSNGAARKYSRRHYRAICDIPLDIAKDELERRLKAFGDDHFGIVPTINLHGTEFRVVMPPREQATCTWREGSFRDEADLRRRM